MPGRAIVINIVVAALVAVLLALLIGPRPMRLGPQRSGDPVLTQKVMQALAQEDSPNAEAGYRALAVGQAEGDKVSFAGLGSRGDGRAPDENTPFELGSITKCFTAMLLDDAVKRGEVRLRDRLEVQIKELKGTPAGGVTLRELATHTSGLPAYADVSSAAAYEGFGYADVAAITVDKLIQQTAVLGLEGRGTPQYSNLGVALLGHALARAAHFPGWVEMVTARLLVPIGMYSTTFADRLVDVPNGSAVGRQANGSRSRYSVGPAYQPAGTATFSTVSDMMKFGQAILQGNAIGLGSLRPITPEGTERLGLLWVVSTAGSNTYAWHNGGVPGFRSLFIVDRQSGKAAIIMSNTDRDVDQFGVSLIYGPGIEPWDSDLPLLGYLIASVGGALILLSTRVAWSSASLAGLLTGGMTGLGTVLLMLRFGPWERVSPAWWTVALAVVVWGTLTAGRRSRGLPLGRHRGVAVSSLFIGAVYLGVAVLLA